MKKLTVFHDGRCGLCQRCRRWLEEQDKVIEMEFLALQSPVVDQRFPGIRRLGLERSLTVVDDRGRVHRGDRAWAVCLFAVRKYRPLARAFSNPLLRPVVRGAYGLVSGQRHRISRWMGLDCEGSCHV